MIGVFDSGYGGLSIFREITRALPEYDFIYFGDNARAPYGDRSHSVIYQYTKVACDWLFAQGCQLIIAISFAEYPTSEILKETVINLMVGDFQRIVMSWPLTSNLLS